MASSPFLHLPLELRRQIYTTFFSTLHLPYPTLTHPLLHTSHQIRSEAQNLFYNNARFNLQTTEHFVDYLSSIPRSTLEQLRYVEVKGYPFPLHLSEGHGNYSTFDFSSVVLLFPGLQLHTLTLHDPYHGIDVDEDGRGHNVSYYEVENLINDGRGWKNLVFKSENDHMMEVVRFTYFDCAGNRDDEVHGRDKQPGTWDRIIKERDGEGEGKGEGAGVEMWVCQEGGKREKVDAEVGYKVRREGWEDVGIEIRVRRGKGADCVQDGKGCAYDEKLLEIFRRMNWREIKENELLLDGEEDPYRHL